MKRRSCDSAIFPLRRNTALANFSKIFVLKRQLYRHWIKYVDCRDCRHADTTDPSRAYRTKPVALNLCCTPVLMLFDIAILSKKSAGLEISTKLWFPISGRRGRHCSTSDCRSAVQLHSEAAAYSGCFATQLGLARFLQGHTSIGGQLGRFFFQSSHAYLVSQKLFTHSAVEIESEWRYIPLIIPTAIKRPYRQLQDELL